MGFHGVGKLDVHVISWDFHGGLMVLENEDGAFSW